MRYVCNKFLPILIELFFSWHRWMRWLYLSDSISPDLKLPISDGTPNESVGNVFVRVTQLMSIRDPILRRNCCRCFTRFWQPSNSSRWIDWARPSKVNARYSSVFVFHFALRFWSPIYMEQHSLRLLGTFCLANLYQIILISSFCSEKTVFSHCFWLKGNVSQLFDATSAGIAPHTSSPVRSSASRSQGYRNQEPEICYFVSNLIIWISKLTCIRMMRW
jgi:hypothetical protein